MFTGLILACTIQGTTEQCMAFSSVDLYNNYEECITSADNYATELGRRLEQEEFDSYAIEANCHEWVFGDPV